MTWRRSSCRKLWIALKTPAKTFGPTRVSVEGCEDVSEFLKEAKKDFEIPGPASHLTLYQPDATTEIDVGESPLKYLEGNSSGNPLIVCIENEEVIDRSLSTFVEYLKLAHIDRPDEQVLATITKRYSEQLRAVLDIGLTGPCLDLYQSVKELPLSFTRGFIESEMNISINGPISLSQPNIYIAYDLNSGQKLFIKLLRIPQTTISQYVLAKRDAGMAQVKTCDVISKANIPV